MDTVLEPAKNNKAIRNTLLYGVWGPFLERPEPEDKFENPDLLNSSTVPSPRTNFALLSDNFKIIETLILNANRANTGPRFLERSLTQAYAGLSQILSVVVMSRIMSLQKFKKLYCLSLNL